MIEENDQHLILPNSKPALKDIEGCHFKKDTQKIALNRSLEKACVYMYIVLILLNNNSFLFCSMIQSHEC
jgi:hypothetical protein